MINYVLFFNRGKSILLCMVFLASSLSAFAQKNPTEEAQPIVDEGFLLFRSELASWHGTDLMLEKYTSPENIGGYFSYFKEDTTKCVFISKVDTGKVIGTVSFDKDFDLEKVHVDLGIRDLTEEENEIFQIRKIASAILYENKDDFFSFYQNTGSNIIPIVNDSVRKVYILTAPQINGVILFGNDYLLTFDDKNNLIHRKKLHNNLIPIELEEGVEVEGAMHSHLPETGDFITATDICTLLLYSSMAGWKTYNVISDKYLNIWNCENQRLTVIPSGTFDKIIKDQENRNKKEKNK